MIQQEITSQGTEPFAGDALDFWVWLGRIKENVVSFGMKQELFSISTVGAPHALVHSRMATTGIVDHHLVEAVWMELIERYGSQQLAFNQQLAKLQPFPAVKAPHIADQLYQFADLCFVTSTLMPLCPDLHVLDFTIGLADLVHKLPTFLQNRW